MLQSHPKIPPNRLIASADTSLQQAMKARYHYYYEPELHQIIILKYYPKYCSSLQLDAKSKPWSFISRIKQIKTTKHFKYNNADVNKKKEVIRNIQKLLSNKRRSIKSLPGVTHYLGSGNFSFLEMCPFFLNIKVLKVFLEEEENKDYPKRETRKSYGRFWESLRNLQRLKINLDSPSPLWILQEIQSSERFLSSLKNLTMATTYYSKNTNEIFQGLLQHRDLLKYATQIDFHNSKDVNDQGDQVKLILSSCPKLHSLTLHLQEGSQQFFPLASINSLQNLTLEVGGIWSFIELFEFPSLLKKLTLYLSSSRSWQKTWFHLFYEANKYDPKGPLKIKDQEKHKKLLSFFERFKQLADLKSLELNLHRFTHANDILENLLLPMLRSIPKLEQFQCQLYRESLQENQPLDLAKFFEGIDGSLEHLKSLKIFHRIGEDQDSIHKCDVVTSFNPQKVCYLPSLTSVNIDTWISEDFDFKSFFQMLAPVSTNSQKEINLSRVYLTSVQSLLKLFRALKEAEQLQTLKIDLGVTLCLKDAREISDSLDQLVVSAKNVSVFLKVNLPWKARTTFQEGERVMRKKYFGSLKYRISYLSLQNSGLYF